MAQELNKEEFNQVVEFHGCYCLDIAIGYRVAKALVREMGDHLTDMKKVFAYVGTNTCAVDAIQKITGCTIGKRNLIFSELGKSVFILQNTGTGKALRAYCHYWDNYDHSEMRAKRIAAKEANADDQIKNEFKQCIDMNIEKILNAKESDLFRITDVKLEAPAKSSKYQSELCAHCGESTKADLLVQQQNKMICPECAC